MFSVTSKTHVFYLHNILARGKSAIVLRGNPNKNMPWSDVIPQILMFYTDSKTRT